MPVQTRARRLVRENSQQKKAFKIWQYLRSTVDNVCDAYIEKDCRLDQAQIYGLTNHKYSSQGYTVLDDLCMQRFWNWFVNFYPMWLAPNLITLIGLITNMVTVCVLSHFSYTATEDAPRWTYLLAALGLFIYQTLDATDGKQVFITLNLCYAMQLGAIRHLMWFVVIVSVVIFYMAHWSTFCTGSLKFGRFDVTEAQMSIIAILTITALVGPQVWSVSAFGVSLKVILLSLAGIGIISQTAQYLNCILFEGSGKNGSTVADTSVIFPLFPLLAVVLPFCMIYSKSNSGVYEAHITVFALCFAAVGAKATNRLVVAHMSRSGIGLWDWIYLSPLLMIINQYYDFYFDELTILILATIYAYLSLLVYCVYITHQFCNHLNIYCFKVGVPRVLSPTNSAALLNNSSSVRKSLKSR